VFKTRLGRFAGGNIYALSGAVVTLGSSSLVTRGVAVWGGGIGYGGFAKVYIKGASAIKDCHANYLGGG